MALSDTAQAILEIEDDERWRRAETALHGASLSNFAPTVSRHQSSTGNEENRTAACEHDPQGLLNQDSDLPARLRAHGHRPTARTPRADYPGSGRDGNAGKLGSTWQYVAAPAPSSRRRAVEQIAAAYRVARLRLFVMKNTCRTRKREDQRRIQRWHRFRSP